jgi:phenylacetyl-CoA:acceptor oxidoreductase subunit 1
MARWGMVIDLRKCIGCGTCREVCAQVNENPWGSMWRRVVEVTEDQIEDGPAAGRRYLTMGCMHCDAPPCLETCPTTATYCRPDGVIDIREDLCIGCGACVAACPYRARSIASEDAVRGGEKSHGPEEMVSSSDRIGICTKCNFCVPIIEAALAKGLQPGVDPEATPLCVRLCLAEALQFGDLDDPESVVSKLIRENRTTRLLEELETGPKIYYILE